MSNQAMTWAFAQNIPSRAKTVLLALANHADHTTGHCWPSIQTIMDEASCSRRATFNFIGALQRNGFIEIRKKRGNDGRQRASDYWLLFDREPHEWQHTVRVEEEDCRDELEENSTENAELNFVHPDAPGENHEVEQIPAPPQSNPCTPIIEPSDSNRQNPESKDGRGFKFDRPKEFSSDARKEQQAKLQAADEARKPKFLPVIEGSKPWEAHVRAGHPRTLVGTVEVNGKHHRGWYFPTLYPLPKQSTGPPISVLMDREDEEQFY